MHRFFRWLAPVLTAAAIFLTVPVAASLRKWIGEHWGNGVYAFIWPLLLLFVLWACVRMARSRRLTPLRIVLLVCAAGLCVYALFSLRFIVERVHYLEFGLFTAFVFRAAPEGWRTLPKTLLALLLCYNVGLLDESFQKLTPNRVAEIRDVLTDLKAGIIGLVFYLCAFMGKPDFDRPSPGERKKLLLIVSLCLLCTFFFFEFVHGYGYRIDAGEGRSFYSSFTKDALLAINAGLTEGSPVSLREKAIYRNEASRHLFQRDFYRTNRFYWKPGEFYMEYGKSWNENRVLLDFYGAYLDSMNARWDASAQTEMDRLSTGLREASWQSRVKETLITLPAAPLRALFLAGLALSFAFVLFFMREKRYFLGRFKRLSKIYSRSKNAPFHHE